MIRFGTHELWQHTRRELMAPTGAFHKGEWMDSGDDPELSPAVFLIEMGPQLVANPHFHRNNQFQVFLKGSGSIGVHKLGPVTVHYAGAFTGNVTELCPVGALLPTQYRFEGRPWEIVDVPTV